MGKATLPKSSYDLRRYNEAVRHREKKKLMIINHLAKSEERTLCGKVIKWDTNVLDQEITCTNCVLMIARNKEEVV